MRLWRPHGSGLSDCGGCRSCRRSPSRRRRQKALAHTIFLLLLWPSCLVVGAPTTSGREQQATSVEQLKALGLLDERGSRVLAPILEGAERNNTQLELTYELKTLVYREQNEKAMKENMSIVYETEYERDPSVRLVIMHNDRSVFVSRIFNKYHYWKFGQTVTSICIFICIVGGNISVLYRLRSDRHSRSNIDSFVNQLAIADLLVGIFSVTLDSFLRLQKAFTFGLLACRASKYISVLFIYSSTFLVVALSINRWQAVHQPLTFRKNPNRASQLSTCAWLLALISPLPLLWGTRIHVIQGLPQCWIEYDPLEWKVYMVYLTSTLLVVPTIIIAFCYVHIVYTIWYRCKLRGKYRSESPAGLVPLTLESKANVKREMPNKAVNRAEGESNERIEEELISSSADEQELNEEESHVKLELRRVSPRALSEGAKEGPLKTRNLYARQAKFRRATIAVRPPTPAQQPEYKGVILKARVRSIKMTLVIVAAFVICWSPFCIINLCAVFGLVERKSNISAALTTFSQTLAHLNSAVNPIIFWLFSNKRKCTPAPSSGGAPRKTKQKPLIAEEGKSWTSLEGCYCFCCKASSPHPKPTKQHIFFQQNAVTLKMLKR